MNPPQFEVSFHQFTLLDRNFAARSKSMKTPTIRTTTHQAGHIYAPLMSLVLSLFGAVLMAFILAGSFNLDALSISDHSTELAIAQDLEDAQREAQRQDQLNVAYRNLCGNADWVDLGGHSVQCLPRHGIKPHLVQLAEVQP